MIMKNVKNLLKYPDKAPVLGANNYKHPRVSSATFAMLFSLHNFCCSSLFNISEWKVLEYHSTSRYVKPFVLK
jgi:hypothetical protein